MINQATSRVVQMIALEYRPRKASRKWLTAYRMHLAGRDNMAADAPKLSAQNGWYDWRIVTETVANF